MILDLLMTLLLFVAVVSFLFLGRPTDRRILITNKKMSHH